MLKKKNRLKKITGAIGKTISTPLFNLKISESGEEETKFGFVVSKKVSKKAVTGKNIIIYAKTTFTYKDTEEVKKNILDNIK